jgi:hypothetical protein
VILAELSYKSYPPSQLDTTGQPLVTEPIDIPVFPYSWYLVKALAAMIATYEGDARASQWMSDADSMMATLRQSALPLRSMMTTIPLAASRFGPTFKGD